MCRSLRIASALPTSGRHLIELLWEQEGKPSGTILGGANMVGLASGSIVVKGKTIGALGKAASNFWGIDDSGSSGTNLSGIRRGKGGQRSAPAEAKSSHGFLFASGDRVGLLVDMDEHTLTILRNGTPVPSLVFDNLPHQNLYVAATLFHLSIRVRILTDEVDA